jgi:hypothetical protein
VREKKGVATGDRGLFADASAETLRTAGGDWYDRHPGQSKRRTAAAGHCKLLKTPGGQRTATIILGKRAIDDDCNQTGQMLSAALADLPPGHLHNKIEIVVGMSSPG